MESSSVLYKEKMNHIVKMEIAKQLQTMSIMSSPSFELEIDNNILRQKIKRANSHHLRNNKSPYTDMRNGERCNEVTKATKAYAKSPMQCTDNKTNEMYKISCNTQEREPEAIQEP